MITTEELNASITNNATTTITPETVESNPYLAAATFLMSALISGGNILTIAAIAITPALQNRSNAFVASLATADLLVGLSVTSFALWLMPSIRNVFASTIMICVGLLSSAFTSILVSIYSMLLVAIDRWFVISYPFLYQRVVTKKVIVAAIVYPWLLGPIFGYSQFFIQSPDQDPPVCKIVSMYPRTYWHIITPVLYYVAVTGIFGFYFSIVLIARRHGKAIKRQTQVHVQVVASGANNDGSGTDNGVRSHSPSYGKRNRGTPKFNEQHWKAAKMMMTVFGVFFVCWTPRIILYSIDGEYSSMVNDVTINLGLLNSGVNFLVYPLHNTDFRNAFKRIICFYRYRY